MKINVIINLKKILFLFLLIFPNKLYASFFEDLTSQIVENPKRLSYGVSVTDVNKEFLKPLSKDPVIRKFFI